MAVKSPLETLLDQAERQLRAAAILLTKKQEEYQHACSHLRQLHVYYQTYQDQIQNNIETHGVHSGLLISNQNFIHQLRNIIAEQIQHVDIHKEHLERQMRHWCQDKHRVSRFSVLKQRSDNNRLRAAVRREQKQLDEFSLGIRSRTGLNGYDSQY